jgi:hypothetical protein
VAEVLLETGWTWDDWCATPPYLQRVVWDVIQTRRKKAADDAERQERESAAARGGGR